MSRVSRFFHLKAREKSVLVWSFILVVFFRVGLWVLPYGWSKQWTAGERTRVGQVPDREIALEIVRSVTTASGYIPYASCLTQALAARTLLRRYGQAADLKIGVARENGKFEAHAWLEIDGQIVLGKQRGHSRYAVLGTSEALLR